MAQPRGRKPRGNRTSTSVSLPTEHLQLYRREADAAGLPLGDYVSILVARQRDLPLPAYLAEPARRLDSSLAGRPEQIQLPLDAA